MKTNELALPIVAVLTGHRDLLPRIVEDLEQHFGKCSFQGAWHRFDHSTYYEAEMGEHLWRCVVSFEDLMPGWHAARFKKWTIPIEAGFSDEHGHRTVNLDPGYVDALKVALVSGKYGGHKVPIAPGVWVDVLLSYNKEWVAFPWAFPDFRDGTYFKEFMQLRKSFKVKVAARASEA